MTEKEFDDFIKAYFTDCTKLATDKSAEYSENHDRFHNFNVASVLTGRTSMQALGDMWVKHIVSIFDMLKSGHSFPIAKWDEKLRDNIIYSVLLAGMVREARHINTWEYATTPMPHPGSYNLIQEITTKKLYRTVFEKAPKGFEMHTKLGEEGLLAPQYWSLPRYPKDYRAKGGRNGR